MSERDFPSQAVLPKLRQSSSWAAHPFVRWIIRYMWLTVILCGAATIILGGLTKSSRPASWMTWNPLPRLRTSPALTASLGMGIEGNVHESNYSNDPQPLAPAAYWVTGNFVQILLTAAAQGCVTLCLHCAELLVDLQRDEKFWKSATGRKGCRLKEYNSMLTIARSPMGSFLFVSKSFFHWYFGQAVIPSYDTIQIGGNVYATGEPYTRFGVVQWMYLTVLLAIFAAIFTYLNTRKPRSPQPSTYGHLQTLADLIDEWHPTMYWGDKSVDGIHHAGTSSTRLPELDMEQLYSGGPAKSQSKP